MKHIFILFSLLMLCFQQVKADSPLTSTNFYTAYLGVAEVKAASESGGVLTGELMVFLKGKNPIAQKMAVINALGWAFEGKNNYNIYKEHLGEKTGKGKQKAENLLCLAYLKALDNYFDCKDALIMADEALALNPESYTFNIIHALIKAQVLFDRDWCALWKVTDSVRSNTNLTMDMNNGAILIIFEYMDLYKSSCE